MERDSERDARGRERERNARSRERKRELIEVPGF
jgi:hypothetical protein